eukprot:m.252878 g.252878  ORF g.252878 m.252878 type:complete len:1172 (+) comp16158_c2_seq3:162-3677(+)
MLHTIMLRSVLFSMLIVTTHAACLPNYTSLGGLYYQDTEFSAAEGELFGNNAVRSTANGILAADHIPIRVECTVVSVYGSSLHVQLGTPTLPPNQLDPFWVAAALTALEEKVVNRTFSTLYASKIYHPQHWADPAATATTTVTSTLSSTMTSTQTSSASSTITTPPVRPSQRCDGLLVGGIVFDAYQRGDLTVLQEDEFANTIQTRANARISLQEPAIDSVINCTNVSYAGTGGGMTVHLFVPMPVDPAQRAAHRAADTLQDYVEDGSFVVQRVESAEAVVAVGWDLLALFFTTTQTSSATSTATSSATSTATSALFGKLTCSNNYLGTTTDRRTCMQQSEVLNELLAECPVSMGTLQCSDVTTDTNGNDFYLLTDDRMCANTSQALAYVVAEYSGPLNSHHVLLECAAFKYFEHNSESDLTCKQTAALLNEIIDQYLIGDFHSCEVTTQTTSATSSLSTTASSSLSSSASSTPTTSQTSSATSSASSTSSTTPSQTQSSSVSSSPTSTASYTGTTSLTTTPTSTLSHTLSSSLTSSGTSSATSSAMSSITSSLSSTWTSSQSVTVTSSVTVSGSTTLSQTQTSTVTSTMSSSASHTLTSSVTTSATTTVSLTATSTVTSSLTSSQSVTLSTTQTTTGSLSDTTTFTTTMSTTPSVSGTTTATSTPFTGTSSLTTATTPRCHGQPDPALCTSTFQGECSGPLVATMKKLCPAMCGTCQPKVTATTLIATMTTTATTATTTAATMIQQDTTAGLDTTVSRSTQAKDSSRVSSTSTWTSLVSSTLSTSPAISSQPESTVAHTANSSQATTAKATCALGNTLGGIVFAGPDLYTTAPGFGLVVVDKANKLIIDAGIATRISCQQTSFGSAIIHLDGHDLSTAEANLQAARLLEAAVNQGDFFVSTQAPGGSSVLVYASHWTWTRSVFAEPSTTTQLSETSSSGGEESPEESQDNSSKQGLLAGIFTTLAILFLILMVATVYRIRRSLAQEEQESAALKNVVVNGRMPAQSKLIPIRMNMGLPDAIELASTRQSVSTEAQQPGLEETKFEGSDDGIKSSDFLYDISNLDATLAAYTLHTPIPDVNPSRTLSSVPRAILLNGGPAYNNRKVSFDSNASYIDLNTVAPPLSESPSSPSNSGHFYPGDLSVAYGAPESIQQRIAGSTGSTVALYGPLN